MVGTNTAADRVIFAFFLANTAELILVVFPFIGPFLCYSNIKGIKKVDKSKISIE